MSPPSANRILLLRDGRPAALNPRVRRYRLARVEPSERAPGADRFSYLRRSHD